MAKVKLFSLSLLAILIIITAYLRWSYAPPTEFFEGDDAAIATGVAHICTEGNIGPYFHSPPHLRKYEYRAFLLALEGEGEPPILEKFKNPQPPPYYRYNTMTGVYFLGALTCNWGEASQRLLMFCFIAGTLFPLFLALFLLRLFRPLPPITLPFSYLLIGLSPEIWISGSVYINDKILAVCFLTVALLFLVYLPDREIFSTFLFVVVAGLFLALAILMRFDTILFIPAILLIILFPIPQRIWKQILPRLAIVGLLFVSAGVIYFSVMRFMHASISIAMAPSTEARLFHVVLQKKFPIILAAYGWGQLVVLICLTIPGLVW
jgi:hypothetical protein